MWIYIWMTFRVKSDMWSCKKLHETHLNYCGFQIMNLNFSAKARIVKYGMRKSKEKRVNEQTPNHNARIIQTWNAILLCSVTEELHFCERHRGVRRATTFVFISAHMRALAVARRAPRHFLRFRRVERRFPLVIPRARHNTAQFKGNYVVLYVLTVSGECRTILFWWSHRSPTRPQKNDRLLPQTKKKKKKTIC